MTNIRRGVFATVALVLSGLPTAAFAEFKPSAELRSACMGDAIKLCSAHLANMDQLLSCLQSKMSSASPRCRTQYETDTRSAAKK
jgi:hypothetical protein